MVEDAQTHSLPQARDGLDDLAGLHGADSGQALVEILRPLVERSEILFDALAPDRAGRLSNDPEILAGELRERGFQDAAPPMRRIGEWLTGQARSLRTPLA